jgi:hypothetical protein
MNQFSQKWQDEKAYILNPMYRKWFIPLIDNFYMKVNIDNQNKKNPK